MSHVTDPLHSLWQAHETFAQTNPVEWLSHPFLSPSVFRMYFSPVCSQARNTFKQTQSGVLFLLCLFFFAAVASAQDSYKVGQRVLELLPGFQAGEQQLSAAQQQVVAAQAAVAEATAALERARALSVVKRQRTE